jgi:hypothetical protein
MNDALIARISAVINKLEPEFRSPVTNAARDCDGTYLGFCSELSSQAWDYPELPVEDIQDQVAYDLV